MAEESNSKMFSLGSNRPNVENPYDRYKLVAKYIKVRLQMLIGIVLVFLIFGYVIHNAYLSIQVPKDTTSFLSNTTGFYGIVFHPLLTSLHNIVSSSVLNIVAGALYVSTAIDLAYMLFTRGLDEAVEPLISGLAATILLTLSNIHTLKDVSIEIASGIAVLVLVLAILFIIRKKFVGDDEVENDESDSSEENQTN